MLAVFVIIWKSDSENSVRQHNPIQQLRFNICGIYSCHPTPGYLANIREQVLVFQVIKLPAAFHLQSCIPTHLPLVFKRLPSPPTTLWCPPFKSVSIRQIHPRSSPCHWRRNLLYVLLYPKSSHNLTCSHAPCEFSLRKEIAMPIGHFLFTTWENIQTKLSFKKKWYNIFATKEPEEHLKAFLL